MSELVERFVAILSEKMISNGVDINSLASASLFDDLRSTSTTSILGQHLAGAVQQQAYISGKSLILYAGKIGAVDTLDIARDIASKTDTYLAESTDLSRAFGEGPSAFITRARNAMN